MSETYTLSYNRLKLSRRNFFLFVSKKGGAQNWTLEAPPFSIFSQVQLAVSIITKITKKKWTLSTKRAVYVQIQDGYHQIEFSAMT